MENILPILKNTPWWVYVLLVYLIIMGLKATRARTIPMWKLFILPLIFTTMSVHTLMASFTINAFSLVTWIGAISIGVFFGWLQMQRIKLEINREKHEVTLGGSWITLVLVLLIFATKYYFGYQMGMDPTLEYQTHFEFIVLAVSGIITGFFIGRVWYLLVRYFRK
jgi:predicted small secreted protein